MNEIDMQVTCLLMQAALLWKPIAVCIVAFVSIILVVSYFFQPKKYKAVFHLTKPLEDIPTGWYEVTFYSDGVKKLGPTEE